MGSFDRALAQVTRKVINLPGVAGTAAGTRGGKPCVIVYLERDDAGLRGRIPASHSGVPVVVEVTGAFGRMGGGGAVKGARSG